MGNYDEAYRLRDFTLLKQDVAALVRSAKQLYHEASQKDHEDQCQALVTRLAADRFNLAVVGQFKRGKSSLMNAVIGRALLPTGLLPLTSAITALCYGPQERVVLRRRGWTLQPEIGLDELAEYVTEEGNPGNEKGLIEARVELPVPFLRGGLYFIDTPGIGSARQENTVTTYEFLPEADAIIFVTSVEAPLSEAEESFLRDIRQQVRKLFIVVNKLDLLEAPERENVYGYIRAGIERVVGSDGLRLYPLSAQQGLAGKQHGGEALLQASGLKEFEQTLTTFLAEEKSQVFLVSILDHLLQVLAQGAAGPRMQPGRGPAVPPEMEEKVQELATAARSLRAMLLGTEVEVAPALPQSVDRAILDRAVRAGAARQQQIGGRALASDRTCPICAVQSQVLFDFYAQWQYTLSTDSSAQQAFTAVRGFCPLHAWQFQQIANAQGVCAGYASLVDEAAAELRRLAEDHTGNAGAAIGTLFPTPEACPACRVLHAAALPQARLLLAQLATANGQQLYARSPGLCLPHLRLTLSIAGPQEAAFLLQEQARHLEQTSEDMQSYMLKREALRRDLLSSSEEGAWRRALVQLVGELSAQSPGGE